MFLNFSSEGVDAFKSKYREVAEKYNKEGISFLIGDLEASQGAFQVRIISLSEPFVCDIVLRFVHFAILFMFSEYFCDID